MAEHVRDNANRNGECQRDDPNPSAYIHAR
jgi:hypothetical protein